MHLKRLVLKLAVLSALLVTFHFAHSTASATFCRPFAVFCNTDTSGGHCGYQPGEDCNTCYGIDGSIKGGGCPSIR